jgi:hypothetical protein
MNSKNKNLRIKRLKLNNKIYENLRLFETDLESYELTRNPLIPENLEEFKKIAVDTIQSSIGLDVKKQAKTQVNLSASNSKFILLLYKVMKLNGLKTDGLSPKEKEALEVADKLVEEGYTESDLMLNTLKKVQSSRLKGGEKVKRVLNAKSIEEVIEVLNEKQ